MNLKLATLEYVALKQSMGMKFETEAALLRSFVKEMGDAVAVATVTFKNVLRYLNGRKAGPVTLFWHRKHDALKGFWEFAIRRWLHGSLSGSYTSRQRAGPLYTVYLLTGRAEEAVGRSHQLSEEVAEAGTGHIAGHAASALRSGSSH
jgi:hypothetical protein